MPLRSGEHRVDVVESLADMQRRVAPGLQELGVEERIVRQEDLPGPHEGRHLLQTRQVAVDGGSDSIIGAAGQTTTRIPGLLSIIMADGPAGLCLAPTYGVYAEGPFSLDDSSLPATFLEIVDDAGREALGIADAPEPREPAEIREQYTIAIPIGTALAQSWNPVLAQRLGDVVGAEMERFGIHLWLAPAFDLRRCVLCGRNFEHLSEGPLLAGRIAAAVTRGVQYLRAPPQPPPSRPATSSSCPEARRTGRTSWPRSDGGSDGRPSAGRSESDDGGVGLTRAELEKRAARVIRMARRLAGPGGWIREEIEAGRLLGQEQGWISAADVRAHFARKAADGM